MRFKTLLLGSATAIAFAGANAQAADLSYAEPVDYVRVCDAFGAGYWYIPGSDTCISVSGTVEIQTRFRTYDYVGPTFINSESESDNHTRGWKWRTTGDLVVDAKTITDWGPLVAYIAFTADYGYFDDQGETYLDEAYISIGPLLVGYTDSLYRFARGYTRDSFDLADAALNQIQLSWAFNGIGVAFGIEDPHERFDSAGTSTPTLVARLTGDIGSVNAKLGFLYGANDIDDTVSVQGQLETKVNNWDFRLGAIWVDGYGLGDGDSSILGGDESGWAAFGSSRQRWGGTFYTSQTVAYVDPDGGDDFWRLELQAGFEPVDGLELEFSAKTVREQDEGFGDDWEFLFAIIRGFGPNG